MGIFSFSDLIIGITLLLNAVALLSYKPKSVNLKTSHSNPEMTPLTSEEESKEENSDETTEIHLGVDFNNHTADASIYDRLVKVMLGIRKLSCCIVLWNLLFGILMIFVFRG